MTTSYVQLKGRGNENIKRKILEQDLPHIIKNITYKMIIVCCNGRKLGESVSFLYKTMCICK
jgi:hypothetical protein